MNIGVRLIRLLETKAVASIVNYIAVEVFSIFLADRNLKNRMYKIKDTYGLKYSMGVLNWCLRSRFGMNVPSYNIAFLLDGEIDRQSLINLARGRRSSFRELKQYSTIPNANVIDSEVHNTVRNFLQEFLSGSNGVSSKNKEVFSSGLAAEALRDLLLSMRDIPGLRIFLVSGTLLGWARNGGYLSHDYDIDLGYFVEEVDVLKIKSNLSRSNNFFDLALKGNLFKFKHINGVVIDLFGHIREGGLYWHGSNLHRWYNSVFELVEADLCGASIFVPADHAKYLEENYGNWEERVVYWNFTFDTPNRVYNRNYATLFYLAGMVLNKFDDRFSVTNALINLKEYFDIDLTNFLPNPTGKSSVPSTLGGRKVAITFGTFDLLHIGHINILKQAKAYCDVLVVGVSTDKLTFEKKGRYPVSSQSDRLEILRSLSIVDQVFYEERLESKEEYIKKFGADVLVMGDDWKNKFDSCRSFCDVVYLPRTPSISTTEIIEKIASI